MKKGFLTVLVVLLFVVNTYSQINFEKGYFIDQDGTRVECLIKNSDWRKNPTDVEYKSEENSESKLIKVSSVKEFGIYNSSRYVSRTVNIDRSASQLSSLSMSPNPIFKEETLFLKVLVEGKANLYSYEDGKLKRFFYDVDDSPTEQLIFKLYIVNHKTGSSGRVSENNRFRQQLRNTLTCSSIELKEFENLDYRKKELSALFSDYNTCSGSRLTTFEDKVERQIFAVSIRPRLNYSSLSAKNDVDGNNFDWGNKLGIGLGIEGEYFLPMNKSKWSILLEPTYQAFSGRASFPDRFNPGNIFIAQVDYKSIELPLGIRHYFFLSDQTRIFVNASFLYDISIGSSQIKITRESGYPRGLLNISNGSNLALGAGFKHKAFGIEFRYQVKRDPLNDYITWGSEYETLSVVVGYSIFRKNN